MTRVPFPQSYWVHDGLLCAGCYPGDRDADKRDQKLQGLLDCGIRRCLNLMETDETDGSGQPFESYAPRLQERADQRGVAIEFLRLSIPDAGAPTPEGMAHILEKVAEAVEHQIPTYLHCWGGHGRTSTVIACYLINQGHAPEDAIAQIQGWRIHLPKRHYPFEGPQEQFVFDWPRLAARMRGLPASGA